MQTLPARSRRRSRRFMLTPLVDVIFLLLTFFMLSSHVAPYSLLSIAARQAVAEAPAPANQADRVKGLLVSIAAGSIQANGTSYSPAEFSAAARDLGKASGGAVVVITKSSATVQDVVTVLEILKKAEFASVSVRLRAAPKAAG